MTFTIRHGMPFADYAAAEAINNSAFKHLLRSPAHYKASLTTPKSETPAMRFGKAVHTATLEPWAWNADYKATIADKRTKAGKEEIAEIEASERIALSLDEESTILTIANAVRSHPTAGLLLRKGHAEVSCFNEIDGIIGKCRFDWLRENIAVDLKTTDDASPSGFARACAKYQYAMQAAWYSDLHGAIDNFIFVAVEKQPPYAVGVYELESSLLEVGRTQYQKALDIYRRCIETGEWPGYSTDIITLQLPQWAMREEF